MPAPLLPTAGFDYTGITRESLLERAWKLYNQVNPSHEDFSSSYPENLLLEGAVALLDLIRVTMEMRARQNFWSTVTERKAAIRLGRLSSFRLTSGSVSTVTGTFTATDAATIAKSITIPLGTKARTLDPAAPQDYRTTATVTKGVGVASVNVGLESATVQSQVVASSNQPNQEYVVGASPYIQDSMEVSDATGPFEAVQSFLGNKSDGTPIGPDDAVFVVTVDDQGQAVVRFGDGTSGVIPQGSITLTYKIGGGSTSVVDAGAKWVISSQLVDGTGAPVFLTLTNAAKGIAGADAMTVAQARVLGPLSMRTQTRCVNEDDYEFAAKTVAGVARAALINSERFGGAFEDQATLELVGLGECYASGYYAPADSVSSPIISAVQALIAAGGAYASMMGVAITVAAAPFFTIDISVRIQVLSSYTPATARSNVLAALQNLFAVSLPDRSPNSSMGFGYEFVDADGNINYTLEWSKIFGVILRAEGVRAIPYADNGLVINGQRASVQIPAASWPKLGTVRVYDEDTGDEIA